MNTHALILTAGLGTRLRPLTDVRAKPAIPVAGVPMIRRIIAWLASQGVDDVVLNLHYLPASLAAVVGDGSDLGVRARYSWELPRILGSAGGPRLARPLIGAERFWIVNGDTVTNVMLGEMSAAHASSGARVTLALVPNREFLRYGGVQIDAARRVVGFTKRGPSAEGSFHYVGVQLADASVFDAAPPREAARSIGGIYDAMLTAQPGSIRAFVCDAPFYDVGTAADYWRTSRALCETAEASPTVGRRVRIDPTARVTQSILWDDVEVGRDAVVDECIVTDRVKVPDKAAYRRAILVRGENGPIATPLTL